MNRSVVLSMMLATTIGCASWVVPAFDDAASTDAASGDASADIVADRADGTFLCGVPDAATCRNDFACVECSAGAAGWSLCVQPCASNADCTDPTRPTCVAEGCSGIMFCAGADTRCPCGRCAAKGTPIATPSGERPIERIHVGDIVFGTRASELTTVRVVRVSRTAVSHHTMVRVWLRNGRRLEMSEGHPTVNGGRFGTLASGGEIGGVEIDRVERVPYAGSFTYDLLTDGDYGAYVAADVLVGSTLYRGAD